MFDGVIGGQIAWLMPAALRLHSSPACGSRAARPRTDSTRASIIVWGGWLVVTALVFSLMKGIFHEYYTVALAPAIAAMVGIGSHLAVAAPAVALRCVVVAAATILITAFWSSTLLARAPGWNAWLRPVITVGAIVTAAVILLGPRGRSGQSLRGRRDRRRRRLARRVDRVGGADRCDSALGLDRHRRARRVVGGRRLRPRAVPAAAAVLAALGSRRGRQAASRSGRVASPDALEPAAAAPDGAHRRRVRRRAPLAACSTRSRPSTDARADAACRERPVRVGRGDDRLEHRVGLPARDAEAGHADRRLQRIRSVTDPRRSSSSTSPREGSTTSSPAAGFGGQNGGSDEAQQIASWVEQNFSSTQVDGVTLYDLSA